MQDSMETYSCPAGSVLIFTESLLHASNDWLLPNPRVAVFNCCEYFAVARSRHVSQCDTQQCMCAHNAVRLGYR